MSDLTDRMRTTAAFLMGKAQPGDNPWEPAKAIGDAINLLIEASNALEAIPPPLGEPMEIIPPIEIVPSVQKILDKARAKEAAKQAGTWVDPGVSLPTPAQVKANPHSPRACPQCDSRTNKRVDRVGNKLMLTCPVCATQWEWKKPDAGASG